MEFESVKAWLDMNISIRKQLIELEDYNEQLMLCRPNQKDTVHVFKGIEIMADLLGKEIAMVERNDTEIPYEYYFMYEGFKVLQLSRERLVQ